MIQSPLLRLHLLHEDLSSDYWDSPKSDRSTYHFLEHPVTLRKIIHGFFLTSPTDESPEDWAPLIYMLNLLLSTYLEGRALNAEDKGELAQLKERVEDLEMRVGPRIMKSKKVRDFKVALMALKIRALGLRHNAV
jgi:hypothetical protein